jgi:uncharacterized membrane protein YfcA
MIYPYDIPIYLSIGCLSGLFTSLVGFGGGFIIVPSLYWQLSLTTSTSSGEILKIAVTTSLLVMLVNMTISTISHGGFSQRLSFSRHYIIAISVGCFLTIFTNTIIDGEYIRYIFIFYMITTIVLNYNKSFIYSKKGEPTSVPLPKIYGVGTIVGFFASTIGVGGSVFTVPYFRRQGMEMASIIPVANLLTLPIAALGLLSYLISGYLKNYQGSEDLWLIIYLHPIAALSILAASYPGIKLGVRLSKYIKDEYYAKLYLFLLAVVTLSLAFKA